MSRGHTKLNPHGNYERDWELEIAGDYATGNQGCGSAGIAEDDAICGEVARGFAFWGVFDPLIEITRDLVKPQQEIISTLFPH